MSSTFWSNNSVEPKRSFRFQMYLPGSSTDGTDIATYLVKTAAKPNFQMDGQGTVKYVQHTFKYPGRVTWQPIDVTILDPMDPDSAAKLVNILAVSGYTAPRTEEDALKSISKKKANDALKGVRLAELNSEGAQISEWTLINPFFTNVNFGTLGYDSDELIEYTLTIEYDYATYSATHTPVDERVRTK